MGLVLFILKDIYFVRRCNTIKSANVRRVPLHFCCIFLDMFLSSHARVRLKYRPKHDRIHVQLSSLNK